MSSRIAIVQSQKIVRVTEREKRTQSFQHSFKSLTDIALLVLSSRADTFQDSTMSLVVSMTEVETGNIHSRIN